MDLKAASGIPLDDGVDGSSRASGRVVPVVHRQVDHHACRALVDERFELRGPRRGSLLARKSKRKTNNSQKPAAETLIGLKLLFLVLNL